MIGLWKYNKTTGYWVLVRMCDNNTASQWLNVWQKDEPNEEFKLSKNKPRSKKL